MATFEERWGNFEEEVGPLLAGELSRQAPVGDPQYDRESGTLAASMVWRDQFDALTAGSVDPRGPIARYVARGTRPHPIDAVTGSYLHFFWIRENRWVTTPHVNHPGTQPNPFHIAAWEKVRPQVQQSFKATVGKQVVLSFLNPWRNRTIGG